MEAHGLTSTHSIEFKREVVQDYLAGETLQGLARRHDLSRNLVRIWIPRDQVAGDVQYFGWGKGTGEPQMRS